MTNRTTQQSTLGTSVPEPNRRNLLQGAAVGALGVGLTGLTPPRVHASGSDELRIGLVGCGGRGTGAAEQALRADKNTRLVAMADAFMDRLETSRDTLLKSGVADRVDVPSDRCYAGFDAYKAVIDQVDVVVLTSTPYFRPEHIAYAVERGVHCFLEKPVATDAPGVRRVLEAIEQGKQKNLAMVSGLCWRYHNPRRETMRRAIEERAIGELVAIETTYNSGGVWDPRVGRDAVASDMEYQMRNWYYYLWLSGDHIVEQAVHGIDTMAWAVGDVPPARCWGSGGRQVRTDSKYGNIWDHFTLVYEYDNGVRGYHQCRHWRGSQNRVKDYLYGPEGICDVFGSRITKPDGSSLWRYRGRNNNMYQTEHDEMFASIRAGNPLNTAESAAHSTLLAIMGRTAAYTGQVITWDQILNSQQQLGPDTYTWADAPSHPIPQPGVTAFT